MTPPAVTSAGRRTRSPLRPRERSQRPPARLPAPAARRAVSRDPSPEGRPTTRRAPAPQRPTRRVSGPARPRTQRSRRPAALPARLGHFIRSLPDHSLLDQVVRGRVWIPLLGILLAGIVAMQVEVLKLSANTGRSLERGTALQSRNEQLRASVAQLGDDQRIERMAAAMGMVMPPPTAVKFLPHSPAGQLGRALGAIQTPNPTAFAATLAADQAALSVATAALTTSSPTASCDHDADPRPSRPAHGDHPRDDSRRAQLDPVGDDDADRHHAGGRDPGHPHGQRRRPHTRRPHRPPGPPRRGAVAAGSGG